MRYGYFPEGLHTLDAKEAIAEGMKKKAKIEQPIR
jgi:hypothetical protein